MKIKILLIALLFSVVGYGQKAGQIQVSDGKNYFWVDAPKDTWGTGTGNYGIGSTTPPESINDTFYSIGFVGINQPTGFTNAAPVIEYGTCVYLNRNDKIQIAKQATRSTYTEYMEDGPLLIANQEITYKSKYGINIPEDAVILFKIKPKK